MLMLLKYVLVRIQMMKAFEKTKETFLDLNLCFESIYDKELFGFDFTITKDGTLLLKVFA